MTAIRRRRTRATLVALAVSLLAVGAAAGLVLAGMATLADSTAGREATGAVGVEVSQRLPFTSTALVGVVDDDGRLTSVVVPVLEPDGTGGTIVGFAATADAQSGTTGELAPLAAVLEVEGPDAFRQAASGLTGLSFDVVEVVDARRFAQLVTPLGDLPVQFPVPLRDASSGEEWAAGEAVLSTAAAARAVTATDPSIADWYLEPGRATVWAGVAARVGAGIGSSAPVVSDADLPVPRSLDEFFARLFAAPVAFRELTFTVIDGERVADQLPADLADVFAPAPDAVVAHDRAEMLMVLGAVAPARIGAPIDAPSFRLVAPFSGADLEAAGVTDAEVLQLALDRLLFTQVNIVSVANTGSGAVPDATRIEVVDPSLVEAVAETYETLFGDGEVEPAESAIEGVDVVVTLGRPFLDEVRSHLAANVAGSGGDVADGTGTSDTTDTTDTTGSSEDGEGG